MVFRRYLRRVALGPNRPFRVRRQRLYLSPESFGSVTALVILADGGANRRLDRKELWNHRNEDAWTAVLFFWSGKTAPRELEEFIDDLIKESDPVSTLLALALLNETRVVDGSSFDQPAEDHGPDDRRRGYIERNRFLQKIALRRVCAVCQQPSGG